MPGLRGIGYGLGTRRWSSSVGVGTRVAPRPLHRPGRAELPHPVPALGHNGNARGVPYPLERAGRVGPALCPGRGTVGRVPLGQPPSLPHLRGQFLALFGGFFGTMGLYDCRASCIIGVRPWTSRCGLHLCRLQTTPGSPDSRAGCFRACAGSSTARGPRPSRNSDSRDVAFRTWLYASAPRSTVLRRVQNFAVQ